MRRGSGEWGWNHVPNGPHGGHGRDLSTCAGQVYHYVYRLHPPENSSYERCMTTSWCSLCGECTDSVGFVSRDTELRDALAGLPEHEREQVERSPRKIRTYLNGLVRRGLWPPAPSAAPPTESTKKTPSTRKTRRRPYTPSPTEWD
ncbi:hypothetical protein Are01nite_90150 [Actinoplanes regularis]|nr:hypothetical protein Are01nite_90150 [Actinoplanes regularis]